VFPAALAGLRSRRLRSALSAVGVAIGIAAMVAVLGVSASSRADLLAQLDALGTNLLRVGAGQSFLGAESSLPETARPSIGRVAGVSESASVRGVSGATVRRTPYIDEAETGGISVTAADPGLASAVGARVARGRFLDAALARYPVVVLGAAAAARVGVQRPGARVWLGDRWFTVAGVLEPVTLAPGLDDAALIGFDVAERMFRTERSPSTIYVRTTPSAVERARDRLGAAANPEHPEEVEVSRPSDALEARAAADTAFTSLLLGLGAVALLVGGVGIANVMVVAVLERRSEIGLRRALGARRRQIGTQFLTEAVLLAGLGGVGGVLLGSAVTMVYAKGQGWSVAVPPLALAGGVLAAVLIGACAGLFPALRAARLAPAEALRSV
jgi:putative ABC transport system permease protein